MKLAIDCRMVGSGGIGSYIEALLPYFIEKHNCILIGNKEKLIAHFNNERIIECDVKPFSLKEMFNFPKKCLKAINSCDIFYSPYCNIPKGIKIPIYTTIHDVVFLDVTELASKAGIMARKYFYSRACKKSKAVFTVSNFSKERIMYHLKTKKEIVVTYNASPKWFLDKNIITEKKDILIFVGNIKKHKGLKTLIDAFIIAKEKGLTANLQIVGNSENFRTKDSSIYKEIQKAPTNSIQFTGKISAEELHKIYAEAKLLIQPSLYEGFGMPPLEAISIGTHAIISDIPVFKEIYADMPVVFFKTTDSKDLSEKILAEINNADKPLVVPEVYSFERTAKIILETLEK